MTEGAPGARKIGRAALLTRLALAVGALAALWIGWSEHHPSEERALRALVHDQLDLWFPDIMSPEIDGHGLRPRLVGAGATHDLAVQPPSTGDHESPGALSAARGRPSPAVVLIHGLDEPGIIWDDLAPALAAAGFAVWELRYPNDQGIDRSAAFLASRWHALPRDQNIVLIGHSMGGLVAREFVSKWRHPVKGPAVVKGAQVIGVVMAGTPNQGSSWARLRIWLELREHFADARQRRFSLFAGLRDGLGEAKLDIRPGSDFLRALNARPWPEAVQRFVIGARLVERPSWLDAGLDAAAAQVGSASLRARLHAWIDTLGADLGDGAVSLASLRLDDLPEPVMVKASHRTMLRRRSPEDPPPPAILPIIEQVLRWSDPTNSGKGARSSWLAVKMLTTDPVSAAGESLGSSGTR